MKSGKYGLEKLQIRIFFTQCASPIDFRREKYLHMCKNKPSLVVVYEKKKKLKYWQMLGKNSLILVQNMFAYFVGIQ